MLKRLYFVNIFILFINAQLVNNSNNNDYDYTTIQPENLEEFETFSSSSNAYEFGESIKLQNTEETTTASTTSEATTIITTSSEATKITITTTPEDTTSTSEASTTIVTTKQTTTTTKPTTTTTRIPELHEIDELVCPCDLHVHSCDMNCCCDTDCKREELLLFSHCSDKNIYGSELKGFNQNRCYRTEFYYLYNVPYKIQRKDNSLFCIISENSYNKRRLEQPKIKMDQLFKEKLRNYYWSLHSDKLKEFDKNHYIYGSNLMALKLNEQTSSEIIFQTFSLPSALKGNLCNLKEPLKFLMNMESKCKIKIKGMGTDAFSNQCKNLPNLNANSYLNGVSFVRKPPKDTENITIIGITYYICQQRQEIDIDPKTYTNKINDDEDKLSCKLIDKIPEPTFDDKNKICINVLDKLHIYIIHNGVDGIKKVVAKIITKSFSEEEAITSSILQTFKANYAWDLSKNIEEDQRDFPDSINSDWVRSGNPGYIVGRPVIMGQKITKEFVKGGESTISKTIEHRDDSEFQPERENDGSSSSSSSNNKSKGKVKIQEGIVIDRDNTKWMTIIGPGDCSNFNRMRKSVLFGLEHNSHCFLNISAYKSCEEMQYQIGNILLGVPPKEFTDRYVASFGNPSEEKLNNWIPINLPEFPFSYQNTLSSFTLIDNGCDNIISSLNIRIVFAYVGSLDFPQAKILSVHYKFDNALIIPNKSEIERQSWRLYLGSRVTFQDITAPPITVTAHWPSISIKLPSDFFYPFSTSSTSTATAKSKESVKSSSLLCIFILINLFFYSQF